MTETQPPTPLAVGERQAIATPDAYLKYWWDGDRRGCRVDLTDVNEPWLEHLNPEVVPLYRNPTTNAPVADREASNLVVNMREMGSVLDRQGSRHAAYFMRKGADAILSLTKNVATNADMRGALEALAFEVRCNREPNSGPLHQALARADAILARTVLQGDQP